MSGVQYPVIIQYGGRYGNTDMARSYWTREQRERATKDGKALISVAIDGNKAGEGRTGKYEHYGPCPLQDARFIFWFSFKVVQQGMGYQAALNETIEDLTSKGAKKSVKPRSKQRKVSKKQRP